MTLLDLINEYAERYDELHKELPPVTKEAYEKRIKELEQIIADLTEKKSKPSKAMWQKKLESAMNGMESKKSTSWIFELNGIRYASDGHRAIKTKEYAELKTNVVVNGVEKFVPENMAKTLDKCIDGAKENQIHFELPTYEVLNELMKAAKEPKKTSYLYTFKVDDKVYGFNAKFLLDSMKATDSNVIMLNNPKAPAYMVSENGNTESIVLPINVTSHKEEQIGRVIAI